MEEDQITITFKRWDPNDPPKFRGLSVDPVWVIATDCLDQVRLYSEAAACFYEGEFTGFMDVPELSWSPCWTILAWGYPVPFPEYYTGETPPEGWKLPETNFVKEHLQNN